MGTTAQKLQKLADTKAGLGAALTAMGRTVPTKFSDYAGEFTAAVDAKQAEFDDLVEGNETDIVSYATKVRQYAFYRIPVPFTVTLPNATIFDTSAFQGANATTPGGLYRITAPNVVTIASSCFNRTSLTEVDFPKCTTVETSFLNCLNLKTVKLNAATSIAQNAFSGCSALADLYIMGKTIAQVKAMANYSRWAVPTTCVVHCSDGNFNYGS